MNLWEEASGDLLRILTGHSNRVTSVPFSPDGKMLVSGGDDGTLRIWDTTTGKTIAILMALEQTDYVTYTEDGYFDCSAEAFRYVSFRVGDPSMSLMSMGRSGADPISSPGVFLGNQCMPRISLLE